MFFRRIKIKEINAGIYVIEIEGCEKFYIGSSKNLKKRNYEHLYLLKRNKHFNRHLQFAFNKYGENSFKFSILAICENNKDFLILLEQKIIDSYNFDELFNTSKIAGIPENNNKNRRRLTEADINNIFSLIISGKTLTDVSKVFNIPISLVGIIIKRKSYVDIKIKKETIKRAQKSVRDNYRNLFTKNEEKFILSNYLKIGPVEISKILNRNVNRIIAFAKNNGLSIVEIWTNEEEQFLIENVYKISKEDLCRKLNKTKSQISSKIANLKKQGIDIRRLKPWSNYEIQFLKENYHKGIKYCAENLNKTYGSICRKYKRIGGLSKRNIKKWSKEDEKYLIENCDLLDLKIISENLNRSISSIKDKIKNINKTKKLNISFKNKLNRWTNDEINYILENYNKIGIDGCSKKLNRNEQTIQAKYYRLRKASNAT